MDAADVTNREPGAARQWDRFVRSGWKLSVQRRYKSAERRAPSAERRAPSAEAMTAPRAREQADPPAPPDRRPPRRGGSPSPETASAAGRPVAFARLGGSRRSLVRSAAALLALSGALALPATAEAQTVTTLVSNIGQTSNTPTTTGNVSQNFTTGSSATGYTVTGVDVVSARASGFGVWVCNTDVSGDPCIRRAV